MVKGLRDGSWLQEKSVQLDVTPDVVSEAAVGPGVETGGSSEGDTSGEGADALVVGDGEATVTPQPATRAAAASASARPLMRSSRGRLW
jgi:hypothetical protein